MSAPTPQQLDDLAAEMRSKIGPANTEFAGIAYGTLRRWADVLSPRPIEPGDRVKTTYSGGTVLATEGPQAWVRLDSGHRCTFGVSRLTRVES